MRKAWRHIGAISMTPAIACAGMALPLQSQLKRMADGKVTKQVSFPHLSDNLRLQFTARFSHNVL